jgi:dihydrofolate synthase/folylpolyglutamate synthase
VSTSFKDGMKSRSARLEAAVSRLDALVNWEKRARAGGGMRVSLDPARDLCARLGSPERAFRAVHVAGSKGKGSTAALVAAALREAGVRTALYTSPHVERIQERLVIDGAEVEDEVLASALERALVAREGALGAGSPARDATWFDVLTSAAFVAIAEARVELAVVECGLGGRLDSTNVVSGPVAAITSIYLEHTAILGPTRAAIAVEKAGIVKPGSSVVVAALSPADEAAQVVEQAARERGARCVRIEHGPADPIELRNLRVARAVLGELASREPALAARTGGFPLDESMSRRARLAGRAERRWLGSTRVVLDGAHVPESLELLLRDLAAERELALPPVVVFGCGQEKNARGLLKALRSRTDRVLCSSVGSGPSRAAAELAALARELNLDAHAVLEPAAALDEAARVAGTGWVLVTGSLHLVGAVRARTRS